MTRDRTIRDFGDQWTHYGGNEGYYGSQGLFLDMLGPLLSLEALKGTDVADIGSGTGRIVRMLIDAGVRHVVALEPSAGVDILRENTADLGDRVEVIQAIGAEIPTDRHFEFVFSIGVIQFIAEPLPTLRSAHSSLRPGGKLVIWVYGKEGNGAYLLILTALRAITTRLPHWALSAICQVLTVAVDAYALACRVLPLPLRSYVLGTLSRVSRRDRTLTIYDQLNPSYVRYYERDELIRLLEDAGFRDIELHHRRGYSWTAIGTR
jgi:SAM-dependent methyltransferase